MFLVRNIKRISKLIFEFIKVISFLFSMIAVCFGEVLFYRNQVLLKDIREVSCFMAFLTVLVFAVLLLIIQVSFSFHVFLFLEIAFLLNILILILFKKIQVPIKLV